MAKYRTRLALVEARQFFRDTRPWPSGVIRRLPVTHSDGDVIVFTPDGYAIVSSGDWIVRSAEGERRVLKPENFEATYEPVEGEHNG
jgi:hypothetical protein